MKAILGLPRGMTVEWVACRKSDVSSTVFGDEDKRRLGGMTGCVKRNKKSGSASSKVKGSMKLVLDIFHIVSVCFFRFCVKRRGGDL